MIVVIYTYLLLGGVCSLCLLFGLVLVFFLAFIFFFFNDTATTEIYTLSLHDALPISFGCQLALATQFSLFFCRRGAGSL